MEIRQIISEADVLTAEQLAKVTGGITPINSNTGDDCKCSGPGANINGGFSCVCLNKSNCTIVRPPNSECGVVEP